MTNDQLTTTDRHFYLDTLEEVLKWLIRLNYWYGWLSGKEAEKECQKHGAASDRLILYDYELNSEKLEYRWYRNHGRIYLQIRELGRPFSHTTSSITDFIWDGKPLNELLVFGYNTIGQYSHEFLVEIVDAADKMIRQFFPGIRARESFRICFSPIHSIKSHALTAENDAVPIIDFCNQIGEKWYCTDCQERFTLDMEHFEIPTGMTKKQEAMFARLTPTLALSILERDGFSCTSCQRSPLKGDNVVLKVVHRVPVTEKGKTVDENLATICQNCRPK